MTRVCIRKPSRPFGVVALQRSNVLRLFSVLPSTNGQQPATLNWRSQEHSDDRSALNSKRESQCEPREFVLFAQCLFELAKNFLKLPALRSRKFYFAGHDVFANLSYSTFLIQKQKANPLGFACGTQYPANLPSKKLQTDNRKTEQTCEARATKLRFARRSILRYVSRSETNF